MKINSSQNKSVLWASSVNLCSNSIRFILLDNGAELPIKISTRLSTSLVKGIIYYHNCFFDQLGEVSQALFARVVNDMPSVEDVF